MAIMTNGENSGNSPVLEAGLHSSEHPAEGPGARERVCLDPADKSRERVSTDDECLQNPYRIKYFPLNCSLSEYRKDMYF